VFTLPGNTGMTYNSHSCLCSGGFDSSCSIVDNRK
jgi:hypothetical protein